MDTTATPQTSFIPKQSLSQAPSHMPRRVSGLSLLAWFIFFVSILSAIAGYLYGAMTDRRITSLNNQIAEIKRGFETDTIKDIQRLNSRIDAGEDILAYHVAISPIFRTLEEKTLKSISFNKFGYVLSESSPGTSRQVLVTMSGRAKSYDAIAQQADSLAENEYIVNPIFSNMTLDEARGTISFDLSFFVDQSLVSYEQQVNRSTQGFINQIDAAPAEPQ